MFGIKIIEAPSFKLSTTPLKPETCDILDEPHRRENPTFQLKNACKGVEGSHTLWKILRGRRITSNGIADGNRIKEHSSLQSDETPKHTEKVIAKTNRNQKSTNERQWVHFPSEVLRFHVIHCSYELPKSKRKKVADPVEHVWGAVVNNASQYQAGESL